MYKAPSLYAEGAVLSTDSQTTPTQTRRRESFPALLCRIPVSVAAGYASSWLLVEQENLSLG